MELALRQRLEGVATVSISETAQTTEVIFAPGDHPFSFDTFKAALKQADVEVVTMEVDACGVVQRAADGHRLSAGTIEFVLQNGPELFDGKALCVAGRVQQDGSRLNLLFDRVDEMASQ
jgi:hypothetical protein